MATWLPSAGTQYRFPKRTLQVQQLPGTSFTRILRRHGKLWDEHVCLEPYDEKLHGKGGGRHGLRRPNK